jgi:hypothetical protein
MMRFVKYTVQDRDYKAPEVMALLNRDPYTHHILSGNQHWYSAGTVGETVFSKVGAVVAGGLLVLGAVAYVVFNASHSHKPHSDSDHHSDSPPDYWNTQYSTSYSGSNAYQSSNWEPSAPPLYELNYEAAPPRYEEFESSPNYGSATPPSYGSLFTTAPTQQTYTSSTTTTYTYAQPSYSALDAALDIAVIMAQQPSNPSSRYESDMAAVRQQLQQLSKHTFKITDFAPNATYTGHEVTALVNALYTPKWFDSFVDQEAIAIHKFLNHGFLDVAVPTTSDYTMWDYAILDVTAGPDIALIDSHV